MAPSSNARIADVSASLLAEAAVESLADRGRNAGTSASRRRSSDQCEWGDT